MVGVLVDVLIERLATLALDKVERELKLVVGVKQEIKNLTKKLIAIRAVLEDAEQRQVMEASVKLWLDELNDVSFDMDDVLDEWRSINWRNKKLKVLMLFWLLRRRYASPVLPLAFASAKSITSYFFVVKLLRR
ncbi:hypothetical protein ACLB2K_076162 [Fragaria x ananassa]